MTATSETAMLSTGPGIETSATVGALAKALAAAQAKIATAAKSAINPHFNKSYADLASVWDACREPLTSNGLSVVQLPLTDGTRVGVSTTLLHASGEWMRSTLWLVPERPGPQAAGSCLTYARRYALSAVAGVAPDDDDGNAANGRGADPKAGKAPPAPRANTVKSNGQKASPEAVKMLHTLRAKVGGLVVCDPKTPCPYPNGKRCGYHTQLAAFKTADGFPVLTSKDLSPEQIANLILRYERKIQEQEMRAATPPDIGAAFERPSEPAIAITEALKKSEMDADELCAIFGIDDVIQLDKDDASKALALVLAYGTPSYGRILADVTGVPQ